MMDATWFVLPIVAALALAVGFLIHKTSTDRRIGGAQREQMERRRGEYADKDKALATRERAVGDSERKLASAMEEQRRKLETIAGLTAEEAKRQLLGQMEEEARREAQLAGMRLEEEARETAREKAKEVLATTIQRLAPDYTVEPPVSVVDLPSDGRKGRIDGRKGRDIG